MLDQVVTERSEMPTIDPKSRMPRAKYLSTLSELARTIDGMTPLEKRIREILRVRGLSQRKLAECVALELATGEHSRPLDWLEDLGDELGGGEAPSIDHLEEITGIESQLVNLPAGLAVLYVPQWREIWVARHCRISKRPYVIAHESAHYIDDARGYRLTHVDVQYLTLCILWPRALCRSLGDRCSVQTLLAAHLGPDWAASIRVEAYFSIDR